MKKIIFVIILVSNIVFAIENQTAWEIYVGNPIKKNANKVQKIEYSTQWIDGEYDEKNLKLIENKIKSLDQSSIELALRVLDKKTSWGGAGNTRIKEEISKIVKRNPALYLESLINIGAEGCIGISNLGEEFVDKYIESAKEMLLRKKALESLPKNKLLMTCIHVLDDAESDLKKIIEKEKKCLLDDEKERVENRLNKFYGDTVNFIQCKKNKTPLEEYVCKDEELLVMFKVLTQGQIYAFENATKEEVNHKTYTKENGLYKDGFDDSDWSIKKYRQNGKVNKKQLCYDLKIQTIETSGLQVYTNTDIARMKYTPKFTNYQTQTTYTNPNKPLIQKDFGRLYRTLLKKALKEKKPKFAGKYIIAQWGCDEGKNACTTGGVIDASTGKATEFPFKYYEHNGSKEIIYKLNSSLIIFSGDFKFKGGRTEENKVLFYEFKDGEFLFLKASEYKK